MNNKTTLTIIVLLVLVILGFFFFGGQDEANLMPEDEDIDEDTEVIEDVPDVDDDISQDDTSDDSDTDESDTDESDAESMTVTYTNAGFNPAQVTVAGGQSVTWVNDSSRDMWVASAMHPTHTVYPGSDIQKCGTAEETTLFDACGGIAPGGTYTFTFTQTGEWGYHNHLNPSATGQVVVTE